MSTQLLHRRRMMMTVGGGGEHPLPPGYTRVRDVYMGLGYALPSYSGELRYFRMKVRVGGFYGWHDRPLDSPFFSVHFIRNPRNNTRSFQIEVLGNVWASISLPNAPYDPEGKIYEIEYNEGILSLYEESLGTLYCQETLLPPSFTDGGFTIWQFNESGNVAIVKNRYYELEYITGNGSFKLIPCKFLLPSRGMVGAMFDSYNNIIYDRGSQATQIDFDDF